MSKAGSFGLGFLKGIGLALAIFVGIPTILFMAWHLLTDR
jgi:hypothetical protein